MRELNGFAYEEIAAVFGVSANAARQAVFEARTALPGEDWVPGEDHWVSGEDCFDGSMASMCRRSSST